MIPARFILPIALITMTGAALTGCKEEPPPLPEPAPSAAAAANSAKSRLAARSPTAPIPKIDPQLLKEYRVDLCYAGTMTLRQARDAYLASLGKAEPSDKKIPNFGSSPAMPPSPTAPAGSGAAKAGAAPAAATPPGASGAPLGKPPMPADLRRPYDLAMRAPHERNARACTAAAAMKEPGMEGVDAALAELAPFAVDFAKTIIAANGYYQREEYKTDAFAKGKELHKTLLADFDKFDDLSGKLGVAIDTWRKAHPDNTKDWEDGQKLTAAAMQDARDVFGALLPKKVDVEAYKAATARLEKSAEALKAHGVAQPTDAWAKIMNASFDAFLRASKTAGEKLTDKGAEPEAFLGVVTGFTSIIESKHRAYTRAAVAKQRKESDAAAAASAPPGAAAHAPEEPE